MGYIDMHCDTLSVALAQRKDTIYELCGAMLDVKRLKVAGNRAQFFAMFLPQEISPSWFGLEELLDGNTLMERMYEVYCNTMAEHTGEIAPVTSLKDYRTNVGKGKISAFLTIENGYLIDNQLENVKRFFDMGVRLITLTWNHENCLGMCHSANPTLMQQGLTPFGKEVISYMNELGMLVDVSHLSDGGFYDVADCSRKPFVASHSNCRSICSATRNLTDDMIRVLAGKGGVAGLNFAPDFVNPDVHDTNTTVEGLCAHVDYLFQVGGEDCVAIGSDFDGVEGSFEIDECSKMPLLFDALQKRGYSGRLMDKFMFQNVERVLADVLN